MTHAPGGSRPTSTATNGHGTHRSADERVLALHEAAHSVVAVACGMPPAMVTIRSTRSEYLGQMVYGADARRMANVAAERDPRESSSSKDVAESMVMIALAGPLREVADADQDLDLRPGHAVEDLRAGLAAHGGRVDGEHAIGLIEMLAGNEPRRTDRLVRKHVAFTRALLVRSDISPAVRAVARELLEHGSISGRRVAELLMNARGEVERET